MTKLKNAMTDAFERAWLRTDNRRVLKQAIRVIDRQGRQAAERARRKAAAK